MARFPATTVPVTATLLLPASERCLHLLPRALATAVARADRLADGAAGRQAQLRRQFEIAPHGWPVAALTRQSDVGDAANAAWLRADPAWVRADINGARMLACGQALQVTQDDVDALLPMLRSLFVEAGYRFDAPHPARWYVRLAPGSPVPGFAEPADVIGEDLFDHLSGTAGAEPAATRRWRTLLSEVQVVLHNHPWNVQRAGRGKPPINSLWFWGGGTLPDIVSGQHPRAWSHDSLLRALALAAKMHIADLPERFAPSESDLLADLQAIAPVALHAHWIAPAIDALHHRRLAAVHLDCHDGLRLRITAAQHWRFWRRSQALPARPEPHL